MEMINRDFTMEKQTHEDVVSSRHCDANGVVFISVNGKRRRLDDVYVINNVVNDTKRKRIDDDDEIVSYKKRRILDIDEVDYEMVEAETRVERARMMADAEEKMQQQIKHQKQIIQLQNQYIKKQNSQKQNSQKQQDQNIQKQKQKQQQQRLKYKLKKQQQIQNAEWLRIQNKRREDAREKADYDDFIREKKRQQMVAYANVCAESEEFLAEQKRKRQILKVFENANADDVICEQKRRRIIADRVADMKDFMYINQK